MMRIKEKRKKFKKEQRTEGGSEIKKKMKEG